MSKLEVIQHLYGYNEWANNRLMETAANVPDERLSETGNASFGNLLTGLAHRRRSGRLALALAPRTQPHVDSRYAG